MSVICLINSLYNPHHRGGAEVVVQTIAQQFARSGDDVHVITLGRQRETVVEHGVTIHRIISPNIFSFLDINEQPTWKRAVWHIVDVLQWFTARSVRQILRDIKADVVMTHNLKGLSYMIPRVIRQQKIRHIHTVHDVQLARPSGLLLFGHEKPFLLIDGVYARLCRLLFGSPEILISPSQWLLQYYRQHGFFKNSKAFVLKNPSLLKKTTTPPHKATQGDVRFLYVGQIEYTKGIFLLLDACELLPQQGWHLTIIGKGRSASEVAQRVKKLATVEYIGRVAHKRLAGYYRDHDMTIVPSLCYENSPTVIHESLTANTPVLAADLGGIGELVVEGSNGMLFAPGNAVSLAEILRHVIDNPAVAQELKKQAFASAHGYSAEGYVTKIREIIG